MLKNSYDTGELRALDAAHHLHPFTDTKALNEMGVRIITRADGVYIHDSNGKSYLDGMAGLWCMNVGYGRREIVDAVAAQMLELPFYNTFFNTTHPPAVRLAAKLAEVLPGTLNHAFFSSGGSDANDTNIRLVRHYWHSMGKPTKKVIIARKNAYHGSTVGAASLGGMTYMHEQGDLPIPNITHINQPFWFREGGDMTPEDFGLARARELETEILRLGADNVAAFIGEPVQGAGGVIIPPATYWPEIERICRKYDILLIADEVITGFGRTGNWFGHTTFGFSPDIVTLAKGMSSGYLPIGAVVVNDRVAEGLIEKGGDFNHGYTYSAHPAAAVAALENLRILQDERIVERAAQETGPYLQERWRKLGDHPIVGEARIVGMMGALELTPDKKARTRFKAPIYTYSLACRAASIEAGLFMRAVNDSMIISPPLVISKAEIDTLIDRATIALDAAYKAAREAGEMA